MSVDKPLGRRAAHLVIRAKMWPEGQKKSLFFSPFPAETLGRGKGEGQSKAMDHQSSSIVVSPGYLSQVEQSQKSL